MLYKFFWTMTKNRVIENRVIENRVKRGITVYLIYNLLLKFDYTKETSACTKTTKICFLLFLLGKIGKMLNNVFMVNSLILINNDEVRANALLNKFMYSRKVGVQSVWEKYIFT